MKPCSMFGASVSMRHAIGRFAHAQAGCLSFGSLLASQRHQSFTRHRQVAGRSAAASHQSDALATSTNKHHAARTSWQHALRKVAVSTMVCRPPPKSLETLQNVGSQIQGSAGMHGRIINVHRQSGMFSSDSASATSLTLQSRGHQRAAHVGAPYFGR
jgi:hypothetical protein